MKESYAIAVIDMQFGASGNGLLSSYLEYTHHKKISACAMRWMPNAENTYPHAANIKQVFIGPGSIIDTDMLKTEIDASRASRIGNIDFFVHECAKVNTSSATLASVGATIIRACDWLSYMEIHSGIILKGIGDLTSCADQYTIDQLCCDTGVPTAWVKERWGVARTFPVRSVTGSKGLFSDHHELEWSDFPKIIPEICPVKKRVKRIFSFSHDQIDLAIKRNNIDSMFLTFCHYFDERGAVREEGNELKMIMDAISFDHGDVIRLLGWGDRFSDIEIL